MKLHCGQNQLPTVWRRIFILSGSVKQMNLLLVFIINDICCAVIEWANFLSNQLSMPFEWKRLSRNNLLSLRSENDRCEKIGWKALNTIIAYVARLFVSLRTVITQASKITDKDRYMYNLCIPVPHHHLIWQPMMQK